MCKTCFRDKEQLYAPYTSASANDANPQHQANEAAAFPPPVAAPDDTSPAVQTDSDMPPPPRAGSEVPPTPSLLHADKHLFLTVDEMKEALDDARENAECVQADVNRREAPFQKASLYIHNNNDWLQKNSAQIEIVECV